jgi:hypothetical protein
MVTKVPQRIIASTGVTSGSYTNANITVNSGGQITSASSGTGASTDVPKISNLQVTNSSWTVLDDTAVDVLGGYILLTGVNFVTGCLVYIGTTPANSVAFVSSTTVRVTLPAITAGTYPVYLVNPDGGVAIRVPGVTISASPAWQTASSLADQYDAVAISLQLLATDATSYSITSGSLPPGLTMNSSGLITGTVTGVAIDTTYTFTVVAVDAQLQDSPRTFTITITVSDPYFKLTTLLLTGNSGNNIVTDASTNNFPITVVGDSRASNFSPYLTGWSNYFDGTGDYLDIATNAAFDFGTGDFTIECWAYLTTASNASSALITCMNVAGANPSWLLGFSNTANQMAFLPSYFTVGVGFTYTSYYNTWTHIAVSRSGTNLRLFANGTLVSTATDSTTISTGGKSIRIGSRYQNDSQYLINGYISNLRIVKGTALYTANFTPATTTLTAVANTSLLTCHANRLMDSSTNNFAITRNGDVRVESFNPFNLTNSGTTGSMYFDGTGDYLSVADNAAFSFGSSDFTIEMWVKTTQSGYIAGISKWQTGQLSWLIRTDDSGTGKWEFFYSTTGSNYVQTSGVNIKDGAWHHLAVSRSGANIRLFTDGVLSNTNTANPTIYTSTAPVVVGSDQGAQFFNGYISDVRVVKGTAVYTSNFTPPTAPATNITNTSLLTLQNRQPHNNSSFQDSSANNHLITRSGNTTQGTFSPFSQTGWSVYLNGSSSLNVSLATAVGTSDFTFECWLCDTSSISGDVHVIGYNVSGGGLLRVSGTDINWDIYAAGTPLRYSVTRSINTWYHIAYSRQGTTGRLFYNGTLAASQTDSTNYSATSSFIIGSNPTTGQFYPGYVSNARIVIGRAVYTSAFTTPTTLLGTTTIGQNPPQGSETKLLTCQSNRFLDNSVAPVALTVRYGSPSVQAFSPFAPTATYSPVVHGGSAYFDGSGDYLEMSYNTAFKYSTSQNFCLELWAYATSSVTTNYIVSQVTSANWGIILGVGVVTSGRIGLGIGNATTGSVQYLDDTEAFVINQWNHVVICRTGSTLALFVNGVRKSSVTNSNALNLTTDRGIRIGAHQDGTAAYFWPGYLSNLRSIVGSNPYDATQTTLTIPTGPVTAIANTSILFNFANDAIEDATGRNVIETVADARTTSAVSKWAGQTSMYFDGTGDYAILPATQTPFFLISGLNWTVECWYYKLSSSLKVLFTCGPANAGNANRGWSFSLDPANSIVYLSSSGADNAFTGVTIPINSWNHIAYVYTTSNTTLRVYLNGNLIGTKANPVLSNPSVASGDRFTVGATYAGATNWDGYIADLRWTTGHARYTSNFTPPTASLRLK